MHLRFGGVPPQNPLQHWATSPALLQNAPARPQQNPFRHTPLQHCKSSLQNWPFAWQTQVAACPPPEQSPLQHWESALHWPPLTKHGTQVAPLHRWPLGQQKSFGAVPQMRGNAQHSWAWQVAALTHSALVQHWEKWMHSLPHASYWKLQT